MTHSRLKTLPAFCAAFCLLSGLADRALTPAGVKAGYLASAQTPSAIALAHAAGEFRITAANIIWLNVVDLYHHQFMAQGGDWSRDQDILPLLHIITVLDPQFVQAYDVGQLVLCRLGRTDEAAEMIRSGLVANPTSSDLYYDMALVEAWYRDDAKDSLPYAEQAEAVETDPFFKHRYHMFCNTIRRDIKLHLRPRPDT
jgi:hypothetical protein